MSIFSGRHHPKDVILWAVRWYCRYGDAFVPLPVRGRVLLGDYRELAT